MNPRHDEIVQANGVDLCVEAFGDPSDPAVLLIMGSSASMDWWEDQFCGRLRDLVADAVGVVDAFGLDRAHVVGMSMGGAIAQLAALDYPDRVASLTLISTGPAGPGPDDPDLPGMSEEILAEFTEAAEPEWSDRSAVIDYLVHLARVSASRSRPFDEAPFRALARRVYDRTVNIASSMTNHNAMDGSDRWRERLGELSAPTLVVHGTEDPVVPYGNGLALAREIPAAELLTLEQTGHELPPAVWDVVLPAIVEHTSKN